MCFSWNDLEKPWLQNWNTVVSQWETNFTYNETRDSARKKIGSRQCEFPICCTDSVEILVKYYMYLLRLKWYVGKRDIKTCQFYIVLIKKEAILPKEGSFINVTQPQYNIRISTGWYVFIMRRVANLKIKRVFALVVSNIGTMKTPWKQTGESLNMFLDYDRTFIFCTFLQQWSV